MDDPGPIALVFSAIFFYVLRSGFPWRLLPHDLEALVDRLSPTSELDACRKGSIAAVREWVRGRIGRTLGQV